MTAAPLKSLELKKRATAATRELFLGLPFAWWTGDCGLMFNTHLASLGHDADLARFGAYANEFGARRALMRHGFRSVIDWADSVPTIERIGWARAIIGDVVAMPGGEDGSFPGFAIVLGNQRLLGFAADGDHRCVEHEALVLPLACWRVRPCRS